MISERAGLVDGPRFEGDLQRRGDRPGRGRLVDQRDGKQVAQADLEVNPKLHRPDPGQCGCRTSRPARCSGTSTSPSPARKTRPRPESRPPTSSTPRGDHRVQHAVRDAHLDLGEGRPGQAEPDAVGGRRGARRSGHQVRAVDRQRQRDPRRPQSADAADPLRQPRLVGSGRRVRRAPARTSGTPWATR